MAAADRTEQPNTQVRTRVLDQRSRLEPDVERSFIWSLFCRDRRPVSHPMGSACNRGLAMYRCLSIACVLSCIAFSAQAESGLASYYGGRGHTGEMTCAHRTRPIGSVVTVKYGGRSIRCRVNDRGPFVRGRIVDVSLSAARALGIMRSGVIHVEVE